MIGNKVGEGARTFLRNFRLFWVAFGQKDRYLTEFVAAVCSFGAGILASVSPATMENRTSMNGFTNMLLPELWVALVVLPGLYVVLKNWWYRRLDEDHDIFPVVVMAGFMSLCMISELFNFNNWIFWTFLFLQLGVSQGYALYREWTDLRWAVSLVGSFCWMGLTINVFAYAEWPWALGVIGYIGLSLCNVLTSSRLSAVRRHNLRVREVGWDASV